jgi:hypothetical protein
MTRLVAALVAPVLLCGLFGPVVLAQDAGPASKFSNQGAFANYDLGNATVYVAGNVLTGASPYSFASLSIIDNYSYEALAVCESTSPVLTISPSGRVVLKFTPHVNVLCPSAAPIVLACERGEESTISSTTYNAVYRGSGPAQVQHNAGWDMYGLRCSILALGDEYQTSGNAYLIRYLRN